MILLIIIFTINKIKYKSFIESMDNKIEIVFRREFDPSKSEDIIFENGEIPPPLPLLRYKRFVRRTYFL